MKQRYLFLILLHFFLFVTIHAQTVVFDGITKDNSKQPLEKIEEESTCLFSITLKDYLKLKNTWNDYFASYSALDDSLLADCTGYQQDFLACLKDPSSRGPLLAYALGEVLFYSYFVKATSVIDMHSNSELDYEIESFLQDVYEPGFVNKYAHKTEDYIVSNFFTFMALAVPNQQLGLGAGIEVAIKEGYEKNPHSSPFKLEAESEQVILYHAINRLELLKNQKIERNTWIELVNNPAVWYLLQYCTDYAALKQKWEEAGFGQNELSVLEGGYLSERSQRIYRIQKYLKELGTKEAVFGISSNNILSYKACSALKMAQKDPYVLVLYSNDDLKILDEELVAFSTVVDLWASRINALSFTGEASYGTQ